MRLADADGPGRVGHDAAVDFDARDGAAFLATRALGPAFFTAFRFVGTRVPFPLGDLDLPDLTARLGLRVEDFLAMEGPPEPVSADDRGCPGHPNRCSETDQGKVCETVQVPGWHARPFRAGTRRPTSDPRRRSAPWRT